jgi:hypothetical protein
VQIWVFIGALIVCAATWLNLKSASTSSSLRSRAKAPA